MPEVSAQEIAATQGTRLSETPPWMSYAAEMDQKLDSKLQAQVDQYASNRHDDSGSQNKEELCRWQEENAEIAKEYQWVHPREYLDESPRIGKVLNHENFIRILRGGCYNRRFWYRDHPQRGKVTLLWGDRHGTNTPEVACWAQLGFMPEYSIMRFDDHGVPLDERMRGWRTCLLQMILKGILTEAQAIEMFGQATGPASGRYLSTLYAYRNRGEE